MGQEEEAAREQFEQLSTFEKEKFNQMALEDKEGKEFDLKGWVAKMQELEEQLQRLEYRKQYPMVSGQLAYIEGHNPLLYLNPHVLKLFRQGASLDHIDISQPMTLEEARQYLEANKADLKEID